MTQERQVAVVTGGGSGIGLAIARRLHAEGFAVAIADVEEGAIDDALASLSGSRGYRVDVSDPDAVEEFASRVHRELGAVDLLINNAGVQAGGPVHEVHPSTWNWVMGVNFGGVVNGIRSFLPDMLERDRGHIMNVSSLGVLAGGSLATGPYIASKTAILAVTHTLAEELRESGSSVRASVIIPGNTRTRFGEAERNRPETVEPSVDSEMRAAALARVAERAASAMSPEEVADVVWQGWLDKRFHIITHPELAARLARANAEELAADCH